MSLLRITLLCLLAFTIASQTCEVPSTITSSSSLNSIFTDAINTIQNDNSLFDYLSDPSFDSAKSYVSTQGRFFIPLWVAGGLSLLFFVICAIQICCFDCCKRK